jgi:hypothetical protein
LIWNSGDDAVDTDQAWAGTLDNFIVISVSTLTTHLKSTVQKAHTMQLIL